MEGGGGRPGMLDVDWLGKLSISLSTQNNCWGAASEAAA